MNFSWGFELIVTNSFWSMILDKNIAKLCFDAFFCVSFISIRHCLLQMSISDIMALKLSLWILKNVHNVCTARRQHCWVVLTIWDLKGTFIVRFLRSANHSYETVLNTYVFFPILFRISCWIQNLDNDQEFRA